MICQKHLLHAGSNQGGSTKQSCFETPITAAWVVTLAPPPGSQRRSGFMADERIRCPGIITKT